MSYKHLFRVIFLFVKYEVPSFRSWPRFFADSFKKITELVGEKDCCFHTN